MAAQTSASTHASHPLGGNSPAEAQRRESRRNFGGRMLKTFLAYGTVEALWSRGLLADSHASAVGKWFTELADLSASLNGRKLTDLQFQAQMEALYRRVDLQELIQAVRLEDLERTARLPDNGAISLGFDLGKVEGAPSKIAFGKQIFGLKKGRSIVPHGHANMCTGFIVLKGNFRGRHWDRVENLADHYLIKPTIDRTFKPGELSTISDHKDNIHWFESLSETGFVFNVHVVGYDPSVKEASGRLYLNPEGERLAGGLIKARKMDYLECHKKFG